MKRISRLLLAVLLLAFLVIDKFGFGFIKSLGFLNKDHVSAINHILAIAVVAWISIEVVSILKKRLLNRFDISSEDNLRSRKLHTQINLLEKVVVFVVVITAIGLIMLSIDSIKEIGIGIFASAGVAGIVIGLSAQKIVGAILAGVQIAITQPFRLDDAEV